MLILSRVCAEFRDRNGAVIFRVTPATRLTFLEVPEAVREDPLFSLLLADGSVEAVTSAGERKRLEADPLQGADPSGRRAAPAAGAAARSGKAEAKPAKTENMAENKSENRPENHLTKP